MIENPSVRLFAVWTSVLLTRVAFGTPTPAPPGNGPRSSGAAAVAHSQATDSGDYIVTDECAESCLLEKARRTNVSRVAVRIPVNATRTDVNGAAPQCTGWKWQDRDDERFPKYVTMETCDPHCSRLRQYICRPKEEEAVVLVAKQGVSGKVYTARKLKYYSRCHCELKPAS